MEIHERSLLEIGRAIRDREVAARDVAAHMRARIEALDPELHCFVRLDDRALDEAAAVDARLEAGEDPGPLAGIPVALKDNLCVAGEPTTCGSRMLESFRPVYDATAVARLRAAGAIVLGKTNMDEFAMGSSTENSAFGPTRNPWDPRRTPGGSSGGSAAAVAARLCFGALGSDTGGSIRQPASFCGVTGLKPTYGRVSRHGLIAFGSSLDQIGPLARDAADAAALLAAIAGHDPRDSTSACEDPEDGARVDGRGLEGLRLGVPDEFFGDAVEEDVAATVREAVAAMERAGATVTPCSLPHTEYAIPVYYIVVTSEASSNLARYDGVGYGRRAAGAPDIAGLFRATRHEGFGAEVKRRIMLGTHALSAGYYDAYYDRASRVRTLLARDFEEAFAAVDVIVGPTAPTPSFLLGEKVDDPLSMYLADILTASINLAGLPAMSVPAGFVERDGRRLPVGLQLVAPRFREDRLFRAAAGLEQSGAGTAREAPVP